MTARKGAIPEYDGGDPPDWWAELGLEKTLTEPRRAFVERLAVRLFSESGESELVAGYRELVSRHGSAPGWEALEAVAEALEEADEAGAPEDEVGPCRVRLVREGHALARSAVQWEVEHHHALLRDIAHDIRSPLNSVLFLVEGLYREHPGELNPTQHRQVGVVYSAAASLLNLVNDILDFSKLLQDEAADVAEVPFGLSSVISNARHLIGPVATHHEAELEFEVEGVATRRGDPQLLTRLLINFVSNAVEAAGEGGDVRVRFEDGEDDALLVHVEDDGPGADVGRVQELLDGPKDRGWSRTLQGSTHGLGLLISGELVRRAGGTVRAERSDGGGTRIVIELPFPPVREEESRG